MTLTREEEAAFAIVGTYFNKQLELLTALAPAIEEIHVAVKRAEVKVKMAHKRPKMRTHTSHRIMLNPKPQPFNNGRRLATPDERYDRLLKARKAHFERSLGVKF